MELFCGQTDESIVEGFRAQNIPVVLLNNVFDLDNLVCVTLDHYGGAIKAVEHLIEKGKRDIAIISGHFSPHVYNERFRGYKDCLKKYDLSLREEYVKVVEPIMSKAIECTNELLALENRPTAIFATNDIIAIGQ